MDQSSEVSQLHGALIDCRHCGGSTLCQNAQRITTNNRLDKSKDPTYTQLFEESAWYQCDRCGQGTPMTQIKYAQHCYETANVNDLWAPYPTCGVCNGTGVVRV